MVPAPEMVLPALLNTGEPVVAMALRLSSVIATVPPPDSVSVLPSICSAVLLVVALSAIEPLLRNVPPSSMVARWPR